MARQRTVATPQAMQAAKQIQSILNGSFMADIKKLEQMAATLTNANEWDGVTAANFRNTIWPEQDRNLRKIIADITQLRALIDKTINDIMAAGAASI